MTHSAEPPGTQQPVAVPAWLVTDWKLAARIAFGLLGIMFLVGLAILVLSLVITLVRFGVSGLDPGGLIAAAISLPIAYLGGFSSSPVLLTGIFILLFGLRRMIGKPGSPGSTARIGLPASREALFALAAKVAAVCVGVMLAAAVVMDLFDLFPSGIGAGLGLIQSIDVDYVRLVFISGPVVAAATAITLVRAQGTTLLGLFGLQGRLPRAVTTSWIGLKKTLLIAGSGLLILFMVGSILESLSAVDWSFSYFLDTLITILFLVVLLTAADVAALFLVQAMAFLQFVPLGSAGFWQWAGVALVAVAFFLGGRAAAAAAQPRTVAEAMTAASLVGVLLSGIGILVAIDFEGLANLEGFAAPAILLPLLWTIPALAGAWMLANERRLPTGVVVASSPTTSEEPALRPVEAWPEPAPGNPVAGETGCPSCGTQNPASHAFCSACGKRIEAR